jgi:hypothetical protein
MNTLAFCLDGLPQTFTFHEDLIYRAMALFVKPADNELPGSGAS